MAQGCEYNGYSKPPQKAEVREGALGPLMLLLKPPPLLLLLLPLLLPLIDVGSCIRIVPQQRLRLGF